ncbi:MAG TPA: serine/threonine-protein kinase [Candidatus Dormibacteraeota bacterium]|nr:serine/threonine-protein kinase [Candidatus Dormibacteraeota bacterium]
MAIGVAADDDAMSGSPGTRRDGPDPLAPARALDPGDRLDRFTIVEVIGHGAFSDVYLALDDDGRRVVLKLPHEALLGDVSTFDRFRREMEIVGRLDHPGIQRSLDLGESRTRPYLALEYVEGVTLREVLRREGRLPVPRVVDIAEQLTAAMAYAHRRGICHRDLKPENVLVTPEGRVVVTDFGIALMSGARRLTWRWLTSTIGTPDYMAPEQVEGRRGDARTDVYALGIMLFEMLAGRVPWEGDNPLAVMSQHVTAPLPSLRDDAPDVPPPLEAIVRKCLRKDPAERYADAGDLHADLVAWQDLDLSRFVFGREDRASVAGRRGLAWLVAGLSLGFLAASALFVAAAYLLAHH